MQNDTLQKRKVEYKARISAKEMPYKKAKEFYPAIGLGEGKRPGEM